jgi:BirA family biotin operon repressor/biotin-[acetyl-CoA-carboxylase] ligase
MRLRERERRIADALASRGLGAGDVLCFDSVGSTMDEAFSIGGPGVRNRTLVLADTQSSGRGRFGRQWHSTKDDLVFSLILVEFDSEAPYGMLGALAVYRAFGKHTDRVRLKWVNDLLWEDGRKIAGVLVEERAGRTVVGVGINLNAEAFPPELGGRATSLYLETGVRTPREEFLLAVLEELFPRLDACAAGMLPALLEEWEEASAMAGRRVSVSSGGIERTGTVIGLNRETGALVLGSPEGEVELYDGSLVYLDGDGDRRVDRGTG